jgi:hypothetical protein
VFGGTVSLIKEPVELTAPVFQSQSTGTTHQIYVPSPNAGIVTLVFEIEPVNNSVKILSEGDT